MNKVIKLSGKVSRVLAGIIFIFSGFVKAIDPLGSTYKFIDYFQAFHLPGMEAAAFPLAILLSGLEFVIGLCLVLFIQNKYANWGALLFMAFFTPLTLWLAITNPVHDCGCFGDALVLTNWETFFKNIVISTLVVHSFLDRNQIIRWATSKTELSITLSASLLIILFTFYNYIHLPIIDFRPYKIGTYLPDKMIMPAGAPQDEYEQFIQLKDTVTGVEKSVESKVYTDDSTYWGTNTKWKYLSSSKPVLLKKGYQAPIHDFSMVSLSGNDITQTVLSDNGYYFILVAYDLRKSSTKHQVKLNELCKQVLHDQHKFICLSSSTQSAISEFKQKWQTPYDFYVCDPITLKTIIRANPGLVLLHHGTVVAKWNANDVPDYANFASKYLNK